MVCRVSEITSQVKSSQVRGLPKLQESARIGGDADLLPHASDTRHGRSGMPSIGFAHTRRFRRALAVKKHSRVRIAAMPTRDPVVQVKETANGPLPGLERTATFGRGLDDKTYAMPETKAEEHDDGRRLTRRCLWKPSLLLNLKSLCAPECFKLTLSCFSHVRSGSHSRRPPRGPP